MNRELVDRLERALAWLTEVNDETEKPIHRIRAARAELRLALDSLTKENRKPQTVAARRGVHHNR